MRVYEAASRKTRMGTNEMRTPRFFHLVQLFSSYWRN